VKAQTESLRGLEDQMKRAKQNLENETNKMIEYEESLDQLRSEMEDKNKAVEGELNSGVLGSYKKIP
jgi:chromosome segregation ATPase